MMALDSAGAKYLKLVSRLEGLFSTPLPPRHLAKIERLENLSNNWSLSQ